MKSFMAIFRVTSPLDINVPTKSSLALQTMGSFCLSGWDVWITNTMFTNKKYPCIFYSFQTYFCCQSRLRMHLVSHFKMKSAIIMILLAMVAVTQANKAGMNNIYGCQSTAFSLLKNILITAQRKKSVYSIKVSNWEFGFRIWRFMQISDEIRYTPRSITLSLISIILHIILTLIQ